MERPTKRIPFAYIVLGVVVFIAAIFIVPDILQKYEEDRAKYENRSGLIGDISRINEPYYRPEYQKSERQVAVKPKPSDPYPPDPYLLSEIQLLDLMRSPTVRVLSRPMSFSDCMSMILHVTATTGTPETLVNTEEAHISQWPISTGGYFVIGCSRIKKEMTVAKSIKVGDWLSLR